MFPMIFIILLDGSTKSTMCKCLVGGGGLCNLLISLNTFCFRWVMDGVCIFCFHFLLYLFHCLLALKYFLKSQWFQWQHHRNSYIELWIVLILFIDIISVLFLLWFQYISSEFFITIICISFLLRNFRHFQVSYLLLPFLVDAQNIIALNFLFSFFPPFKLFFSSLPKATLL